MERFSPYMTAVAALGFLGGTAWLGGETILLIAVAVACVISIEMSHDKGVSFFTYFWQALLLTSVGGFLLLLMEIVN